MHPQSNKIDTWFRRGKDAIIICASLGSLFLFLVKYYQIPAVVDAHEFEIKTLKATAQMLHEEDMRLVARLDTVDLKQDYTNKSLDEQKAWLKNISAKLK